jgi:hypothetical protein
VIWRTALLLLHAALNVFIVTRATDYDITSSWLYTLGFLVLGLLLLAAFIYHLVSFYHFIKTKT